jgi:hypothetical protein
LIGARTTSPKSREVPSRIWLRTRIAQMAMADYAVLNPHRREHVAAKALNKA